MKEELIGYVRPNAGGDSLKIVVAIDLVAPVYEYGKDGTRYVVLKVRTQKMKRILSGEQTVTSITQIVD